MKLSNINIKKVAGVAITGLTVAANELICREFKKPNPPKIIKDLALVATISTVSATGIAMASALWNSGSKVKKNVEDDINIRSCKEFSQIVDKINSGRMGVEDGATAMMEFLGALNRKLSRLGAASIMNVLVNELDESMRPFQQGGPRMKVRIGYDTLCRYAFSTINGIGVYRGENEDPVIYNAATLYANIYRLISFADNIENSERVVDELIGDFNHVEITRYDQLADFELQCELKVASIIPWDFNSGLYSLLNTIRPDRDPYSVAASLAALAYREMHGEISSQIATIVYYSSKDSNKPGYIIASGVFCQLINGLASVVSSMFTMYHVYKQVPYEDLIKVRVPDVVDCTSSKEVKAWSSVALLAVAIIFRAISRDDAELTFNSILSENPNYDIPAERIRDLIYACMGK